jgi:hypothetical protein
MVVWALMYAGHAPVGRKGWSGWMADIEIANYRVLAMIAGN